MSRLLKFVFFFALLWPLSGRSALLVEKERSVSPSRQFIVYGADLVLRGAMCDLAERNKSQLLRLLEARDEWKTPLVIRLDYPQANYPEAPNDKLEVSQTGFGLKLQLDLLVSANLQGAAVQRELLRAILLERIYRDRGNVAAGTPYVTPPDWLVDGLLALTPAGANQNDSEILRAVVAAQKIAPLESVVTEKRDRLDLPSQRLHDAYSKALVQLLLETPDGRAKVEQYLHDLPDAPNDALADLRVHFPATLGQAPARWWILSVAGLSASDRYENLSVRETGEELDRILHFSLPDKTGKPHPYSLGEYPEYEKLPGASEALRQVGEQLLVLSARAHPSFHPIVQEDFALTEQIAQKKTKGLAERFARVASYRKVVEEQSGAIDDYLNWYQATQSKSFSGAFNDLLRPPDETHETRRRDPISVYLDSVEMETN